MAKYITHLHTITDLKMKLLQMLQCHQDKLTPKGVPKVTHPLIPHIQCQENITDQTANDGRLYKNIYTNITAGLVKYIFPRLYMGTISLQTIVHTLENPPTCDLFSSMEIATFSESSRSEPFRHTLAHPLWDAEITHPLTHPHTPLLTSACGQPKAILRLESKDWSYIHKDSNLVDKDWK